MRWAIPGQFWGFRSGSKFRRALKASKPRTCRISDNYSCFGRFDARLGDTNGKEASPERALDSSAAGFEAPQSTDARTRLWKIATRASRTALKGVEATHVPHLGQLFLLRDIDVRLGETNGKEASPERALDSSATASRGVETLCPSRSRTIPNRFGAGREAQGRIHG